MAERDSAAKRRRDRRLRMHWRHEQLTLRMALAAALHHSRDVGPVTYNALRSQKTARAWEEEENEMHFATGQTTPPPRAAAAEYYPLTPGAEAGGVLAAGGRPSPLVEVRPQDRVLRRTVEQNVDAVTFPTLDVPMPQKVDQPLALLLSAHFPDPEQVIEVPKISLPSRPTRRFPRILQSAEQLVEVSLEVVARLRLIEPIADIPALRGPYGTSGLRGFLPRQGYSLTAEQIVDNPVPRRGFDEGLQGFPPGQSSAASSEQTVHIPVPHGGRHDLSPSSADFSNPPDTANQGVFRTFPRYKKSAKIPRTQ